MDLKNMQAWDIDYTQFLNEIIGGEDENSTKEIDLILEQILKEDKNPVVYLAEEVPVVTNESKTKRKRKKADHNISPEEVKEERRKHNCEAARVSRLRKKQKFDMMELENKSLKSENKCLKDEIEQLKNYISGI